MAIAKLEGKKDHVMWICPPVILMVKDAISLNCFLVKGFLAATLYVNRSHERRSHKFLL